MKIVINKCYGGFGLSDLAYERLIELGIPVKKYKEGKRGKDGLFKREKQNEGKIIFDRRLSPIDDKLNSELSIRVLGRYWDCWIDRDRTNELLIRVVEELGDKSNGRHAKLQIVEIPDGIKWFIDEYDGIESIHEEHRSW